MSHSKKKGAGCPGCAGEQSTLVHDAPQETKEKKKRDGKKK